jgi:tetratricopeptide (TPR) repeat protein
MVDHPADRRHVAVETMPPPRTDALRQTLDHALKQVRSGRVDPDFDEQSCRAALIHLARPPLESRADPAAAALNAIALVAAELLQHDLAVRLFAAAVAAAPANADYHLHLGSAHRFAGDLPAAVDAYRACLQLRPNWPKAIQNLAETLDLAGHGGEAIAEFTRLHSLIGDDVRWQVNLGTVHLHQHRSAPAIAAFGQAIALSPANPVAHYKLGWALLATAQFAQGWRQYEWRTPAAEQARRVTRYRSPPWNGQDLHRKTLLLEPEQGLGDMLQFIRYAPLLADQGARVLVECPSSLQQLIVDLPFVAGTITPGDPLPPHDFHVLPMSIPLHMQTLAETIPAQASYLTAAPAAVDLWRGRLGDACPATLRVGIAWAGNRLNRNDSRRSCPPKWFDQLSSVSACTFVNLQKPQPFDVGKPNLPMLDHAGSLTDLADTAGLIANLDLVITVDTAVAHLAGALGKPVWILLGHFPDWRWQWDRTDSPWYPTARLFRQPAPGEWARVMGEVAVALQQLVSAQRRPI